MPFPDHRALRALRSAPALEDPIQPASRLRAPSVTDLSNLAVQIPELAELTAPEEIARAAELAKEGYGRTLSFDWDLLRLRRKPDGDLVVAYGSAALLEDVVKTLLTPRFRVTIYGPDYGAEFEDVIGLDEPTARAQVSHIIEEALLVDPRVASVEIDQIITLEDGALQVVFSVTDFTGAPLRAPEVIVRMGGTVV